MVPSLNAILKAPATLLVAAALCVMGGCAKEVPTAAGQPSQHQQADVKVDDGPNDNDRSMGSMEEVKKHLDAVLAPGMAYADARAALLEAGWEPIKSPDCMQAVVGGDWENVCRSPEPAQTCSACESMAELASYSGEGIMLARFRHPQSNAAISVNAYGMLRDWSVNGDDSRLQYSSWEFE